MPCASRYSRAVGSGPALSARSSRGRSSAPPAARAMPFTKSLRVMVGFMESVLRYYPKRSSTIRNSRRTVPRRCEQRHVIIESGLSLTDSTVSFPPPKPFSRSMGVRGILLLTLSATAPACSLFVLVPGVIQQAGTGAFLAMVVAGLIALVMGFVYAELSSAFPLAGGEY